MTQPTSSPEDAAIRKQIVDAMLLSLAKVFPKDMPRPTFQASVDAILAIIKNEGDRRERTGKEEIMRIGKERLANDETYTLDAFIQDCEEYLSRVYNIGVDFAFESDETIGLKKESQQ